MAEATYVNLGKVQGYIIDPAALLFERKDGKNFLMRNGTSGSVSTSKDNITISNGWIQTPQLVLDTTTEDVISYTSNMTDLWLIAGANNLIMESGSHTVTDANYYVIEQDGDSSTIGTFEIEGEVTNVKIEGLESMTGSTPTAGKFIVSTSGGNTVVKLLTADRPVGDEIAVTFSRTMADSFSMEFGQNTPSAVGRLTRITPIYASEDDGGKISAYIYDVFSKVKVTGVPGFDQNYKSESTSTIEFTSVAQKAANAVRRKIVVG